VALETFRRPGAAPWTRHAEAGLRACGVTTGAPTAAGALADLTAQQREIVILANGGLTNSEIADRLSLTPYCRLAPDLHTQNWPICVCTPRLPTNEVSAPSRQGAYTR
jgi:hypothetical protein